LDPLEGVSEIGQIICSLQFGLSSCINIRTRFECVFLRRYFVKILANASALAPFLPRIDAKTQRQNSLNLKQDKKVVFQGGRSREYCRISRPTTKKDGFFTCFRRVRILTQLLIHRTQ